MRKYLLFLNLGIITILSSFLISAPPALRPAKPDVLVSEQPAPAQDSPDEYGIFYIDFSYAGQTYRINSWAKEVDSHYFFLLL